MKKEIESESKTTLASQDVVKSDGDTRTESREVTYRQINSVSFQENFKTLIGHYEAPFQEPRVG